MKKSANLEIWFDYEDRASAEKLVDQIADIVMGEPDAFMTGTLDANRESLGGDK